MKEGILKAQQLQGILLVDKEEYYYQTSGISSDGEILFRDFIFTSVKESDEDGQLIAEDTAIIGLVMNENTLDSINKSGVIHRGNVYSEIMKILNGIKPKK